jgi:hypothetical protein
LIKLTLLLFSTIWLIESSGSSLEVSGINALELVIDFLAHFLQIYSVDLHSPELFFNASQRPHGSLDLLNEVFLVGHKILGHQLELVHLANMLLGDNLLLLSLHLALLDLLLLNFFLLLLVLFPLDDGDSLVELGQEVAQLGVDLVGEVAEVDSGFIVDALEEHDRCEVLLKVLNFAVVQLSLEDIDYAFLLGGHDLFSQPSDGFLEFDYAVDVSPQILHFYSVYLNNLSTDDLYLVVGPLGDFVDEVPDC